MKRKSLSWPGIGPRNPGLPATNLVTILTDLPQIQVNKKAEVRRSVTNRVPTGVCNQGQMDIGMIQKVSRSGHGTMALGLTQLLTEISTRNISLGGKGGRCVGLTILPPSCADCLNP